MAGVCEALALELVVRASPQTGRSDHLSAVVASPQKGYGRGVRGTGSGDGSSSLPTKKTTARVCGSLRIPPPHCFGI